MDASKEYPATLATSPEHVVSAGFTFAKARDMVFEMEALLRAHGVEIKSGSLFDEAGFAALRVAEGEVNLFHDMRKIFPQLVGVTELAHQLVRNKNHRLFSRLVPHLTLLSKGAAIQLGYSSDDATNKIFELLIACWILPLCTDIELDDPIASAGGTNPDIIAIINGVRWGIACKVLHSSTPQQLITTIEKGVSQVKASTAQRGIVIVSMKNQLLLDEYWKELQPADPAAGLDAVYDVFLDEMMPFSKLKAQLEEFIESAIKNVGIDHIRTVLVDPSIVPAIVLWGHTLSPVLIDEQPVITSVRMMVVAPVVKGLTPDDTELLKMLNASAMSNPDDA